MDGVEVPCVVYADEADRFVLCNDLDPKGRRYVEGPDLQQVGRVVFFGQRVEITPDKRPPPAPPPKGALLLGRMANAKERLTHISGAGLGGVPLEALQEAANRLLGDRDSPEPVGLLRGGPEGIYLHDLRITKHGKRLDIDPQQTLQQTLDGDAPEGGS